MNYQLVPCEQRSRSKGNQLATNSGQLTKELLH